MEKEGKVRDIKLQSIGIAVIILNLVNILFTDTASKHGLPLIQSSIWTLFLLIILLFVSLPVLLNTNNSYQNLSFNLAIILAIFASLLKIFNFNIAVNGYTFLIIFISLFTIIGLGFQKHYLFKLYTIGLIVAFVNLLSLVFYEFVTDDMVLAISVSFEVSVIFGLIGYLIFLKISYKSIGLLIATGGAGGGLAWIILQKDVPLLIIRTVLEQSLGISELSLHFAGITIGKDQIFMLHMIEIFVTSTIILIIRRNLFVLNLIFVGFDLTYPPIILVRTLILSLYINSDNEKTQYLAKNYKELLFFNSN